MHQQAMMDVDAQTQRQLSEQERAMNAGLELAFTLTIIQSSLFSATYMYYSACLDSIPLVKFLSFSKKRENK